MNMKEVRMPLQPMSAREVLAAYPEARQDPYDLRVHRDGLARKMGAAWLHATPNEDGSWQVTGYLGQFGDRRGRRLLDRTVHPEQQVQDYLDRTGAEASTLTAEDRAGEIVGAVTNAAWTLRTQEAHLPLLDRFPSLTLEMAGGACPFQAEGTLFGMPFYFRYRSAYATLRLGEDWFDKPLYASGMEYGEDDLQGWLEDEEFHTVMGQLILSLKRASIRWEFPGVESTGYPRRPKGTPMTYAGIGDTPAEAWAELHERMEQWIPDMGLVNATLTTDDRAFPDPEPDWAHCAVDPATDPAETVR